MNSAQDHTRSVAQPAASRRSARSQSFTLAGGVDVVRAVGVDGQQQSAGHVRMTERQLDPVAGQPEVALDQQSETEEPICEVLHQGVGLQDPGRLGSGIGLCGRDGKNHCPHPMVTFHNFDWVRRIDSN